MSLRVETVEDERGAGRIELMGDQERAAVGRGRDVRIRGARPDEAHARDLLPVMVVRPDLPVRAACVGLQGDEELVGSKQIGSRRIELDGAERRTVPGAVQVDGPAAPACVRRHEGQRSVAGCRLADAAVLTRYGHRKLWPADVWHDAGAVGAQRRLRADLRV